MLTKLQIDQNRRTEFLSERPLGEHLLCPACGWIGRPFRGGAPTYTGKKVVGSVAAVGGVATAAAGCGGSLLGFALIIIGIPLLFLWGLGVIPIAIGGILLAIGNTATSAGAAVAGSGARSVAAANFDSQEASSTPTLCPDCGGSGLIPADSAMAIHQYQTVPVLGAKAAKISEEVKTNLPDIIIENVTLEDSRVRLKKRKMAIAVGALVSGGWIAIFTTVLLLKPKQKGVEPAGSLVISSPSVDVGHNSRPAQGVKRKNVSTRGTALKVEEKAITQNPVAKDEPIPIGIQQKIREAAESGGQALYLTCDSYYGHWYDQGRPISDSLLKEDLQLKVMSQEEIKIKSMISQMKKITNQQQITKKDVDTLKNICTNLENYLERASQDAKARRITLPSGNDGFAVKYRIDYLTGLIGTVDKIRCNLT